MDYMDYNYLENKSFGEWAWKDDKNINILIQNLNQASGKHDYVRRRKCLPRLYGVTIDVGNNWKLCKIGLTRTDRLSRIQSVKQELDIIYGEENVRLLFVLDVSGTDRRNDEEIQSWVRRSCGYSVNSKLATLLGLKWKTEWVLTTQNFIETLNDRVNNAENANTLLFDRVKFETETTGNLPLYLENYKKQKVEIELRRNEIIPRSDIHYEDTLDEDRSFSDDDDSSKEDDKEDKYFRNEVELLLKGYFSSDDTNRAEDLPVLSSSQRSFWSNYTRNEVSYESDSSVQSTVTGTSKVATPAVKRAAENEDGGDNPCRKRMKPQLWEHQSRDEKGNVATSARADENRFSSTTSSSSYSNNDSVIATTTVKNTPKRLQALLSGTRSRRCPCPCSIV